MSRALFLFLIILISCNSPSEKGGEITLVVTTTSMIADGVRAMTDSSITVVSLMGPGTDPHLFKPSKKSLDLLEEADVIVANGLHLEGRMQEILEKISRGKPVVFLGEYLDDADLIFPSGVQDFPDPHIWFDLSLWKKSNEFLSLQLDSLDILNLDGSRNYIQQLDSLDSWVRKNIESIPVSNRVLLTAHDAFSYFGRAYGMEVIGLQGISTTAEYGIKDIENMVDLIVDREIKAVFVESSISSRSMEAVVQGVKRNGREVVIGGTLYSDAPGPEKSGAETYTEMVVHNVQTLKRSLK